MYQGFTLVELAIVMAVLAILASIVIVGINPTHQLKSARDAQRVSHVAAISAAVNQNILQHRGVYKCSGVEVPLPTSTTTISSESGGFPIGCLVPNYLSAIPIDPNRAGATYTATTTYNTQYQIIKESDGRVSVWAVPEVEGADPIRVTR
jgi:prepilin-type N-terminal cleavage/methylation domain-containing protein